VAEALGCAAEVFVKRLTPAMINAEEVARHIQQVVPRLLPDADLDTSNHLTMVAEDMAFMLEKIPGCYFLVGSADSTRGLDYGHHHPKFDFDEQALPHAAALMAGAVMELLQP
jgi:metal-dependent amidase/aminoacylase/carboxypeptidase family protein